MNKDTVVASVIGFGLGLIAAIGLWVVPRILPKTKPAETPTTEISSETKAEQVSGTTSLEVTSPSDGQILKSDSLTIQGKATTAEYIVVTTTQEFQVVKPTPDGEFAAKFALQEGANEIRITGYQGNATEAKTLTVFYWKEEI